MTAWDWLIVLVLNGGIILYGLHLSRGMRSSADWFLIGIPPSSVNCGSDSLAVPSLL